MKFKQYLNDKGIGVIYWPACQPGPQSVQELTKHLPLREEHPEMLKGVQTGNVTELQ